ncbi:ABC transporter ATP-binding protein [Auritidibacter ignavus]|uniref:ABC transporter ATP-binding protein n=1 Tax=Auritidibacter ignavus TaxID=678932 RepID=UPI00244881EC|nr:ABC transporter ATP-binding protein [Auritidibacter ignavus]WGH81972.1 ABC transporter ATP-binding protein [Auritidibacter ignavus]WGH86581.1 ABC transporter ATP-binding protein [Auritidibacter ignavus]WGH88867.1 ABC transporter ATP-binding protein [Auritidibacter ignavus]
MKRLTPARVMRLALSRGGRGWRLSAATAGFILHQASEAAVPILIGVAIDRAVLPRDPGALALWLGVLGAVFLVLSVSYQGASLAMVRIYGHGEHDLRQLAVARVLDPRGIPARRTGEVLSVVTSDTYRVAGVAWSVAEQAATIAALLTAVAALLLISIPLGLGVLAAALLVLCGMAALARPLERLGMAEQSAVSRASDMATDAMEGLRIIHGLAAHPQIVARYREASTASRDGAIRASRSLLTYQAVSTAVSILHLGTLAAAAGWMAMYGTITPGQLITVVGLAQFLQASLDHIGTFGANWAHKRASAWRLHDLLTEPHPLPAGQDTRAECGMLRWTKMDGPVIEAQPGRMVGIRVAGARQAHDVASRLGFRSVPAPSELMLGGVDALTIGPAAYREHVLAPPHDAFVFTGSIRHNVTLTPCPLNDVVVKLTALDDVIEHVGSPDAPVGEQGRRLSGGQRQRLLLARALHTRADILVLEEPATALDPITTHRVGASLARCGRTILLITSDPILLDSCATVIDLTTPHAIPHEVCT